MCFPDNAAAAADDDDEKGDGQKEVQRTEKELSKVYVCIEGIRKILSAGKGSKKSVNYPASKYLMRFAAEKAQREHREGAKDKANRREREEDNVERESERDRKRECHNKHNNMRGIRSSLTKTNREK